jgi:glutamyl-tRNA synthetase
LYNWLLARKEGGRFLLRIEDTDRSRFVADAEQDILDALAWAGIDYDEGPGKDGPVGPYRQSERMAVYRKHVTDLLDSGHAYVAFDTPEEIEALRERLVSPENPMPRYDAMTRTSMRNSLVLSTDEVERLMADGVPHVIRLKVEPGNQIHFQDAVRGDVAFTSDSVDDQILVKSDGMPTYHLANVVDDHEMGITHVIRGEEWLPSTPKHVLLYQAFGWDAPVMAHLPLILSPTGGKLSKRNADKQGIPVFVSEYRKAGYEPAALVNFLALLGWNPGTEQEVFSLEEMAEAFSLDRVGNSGVQFDADKLDWFNAQYLRQRRPSDIAAELHGPLTEAYGDVDEAYVEDVVAIMLERMTKAVDVLDFPYFFADVANYDEQAVSKRWKEDAPDLVSAFADRLAELPEWTEDALEESLRVFAESRETGAGRIIHPVRLAVSGVSVGPGLFALLRVLGRDTVIRRLRKAVDVLPNGG